MRLDKKQKEALITWVAAGLESDEINKRAAKFKPPFKVSRNTVKYYRQSRDIKLEEIKEADETSALKTGLSIKENRVATLQRLANRILEDILGNEEDPGSRLWLDQVKGIGSRDNYERVEYQEFNRSEVESLRGLLDDIASELGERQPGVQVNNTFTFDMENWKEQRSKRLKEVGALEAE